MNVHELEARAKERAYYMYINGEKFSDGSDFASDYHRYMEALRIEKVEMEKELDEQFLKELDTELLTPKQLEALTFINKSCRQRHDTVIAKLSQYHPKPNDFLVEKFANIPLYINVPSKHIDKIANDTHYRNQFETNVSSGTLSRAQRTAWEHRLFGNQNGYSSATDFERPKYGNLPANIYNVSKTHYVNDIACGYGNMYFVLKEEVRKRTTFTYGDSASKNYTSVSNFNYPTITLVNSPSTFNNIKSRGHGGSSYFELQIHGPVRLDTDIEMLRYPSSYGYETEYADAFELLKKKGIEIKPY